MKYPFVLFIQKNSFNDKSETLIFEIISFVGKNNFFTFDQIKKRSMKNLKKDQNKKLFLNKQTITILNKEQQGKLVGGEPTGTTFTGTSSILDWLTIKR